MTETDRIVKPRALAAEEAIQLALESRWAEAVLVNRRIIEQHGPDEEVLNRLGKSLAETGEVDEAIASYRQTLEINSLNIIAPKMIRKLQALQASASGVEGSNSAIDIDLFTEEPGRTGRTQVTAPAEAVAAGVIAGDMVELLPEGAKLLARTARGVDLGSIESKLARRLLPLMATGNRYEAAVARIDGNKLELMIRETMQSQENARKTSFPIARGTRRDDFRPYAKGSLLAARNPDDGDDDDDEDSEGPGLVAAADEDDLPGMQTVEGELEESVGDFKEADEDDDDSRPEDSY